MKPAELASVSKVIDIIGGLRLQEITGASSQSVTNWRGKGYFPARYVLIMLAELATLGYRAPLKLWRIDVPPRLRPLVETAFAALIRILGRRAKDMREAS